ncbi:8230_t:CDS:2 [Funneliformis geosporum]|uniref:13517_t:CDS:1 n=1 Tax=Funneliformis geosporum TaxID=1117311 RepID=A0A9W4WW45_9GLOM|nr:8230_t:CDS:2 [Funneliformis geosporum]CAI2168006.1 13517_t:CDS:2 [Funneliformis geosporum]
MSSTNSSPTEHHITSRTWNSEGMVISNISGETGISQLMETATFIYPINLSASTNESKNTTESQQSNIASLPQNSIFPYDFICVEELRKLAEVSNQIYSSTSNTSNSTLPVVDHVPTTSTKSIQPASFNSSASSPISEIDGSERSSSSYFTNEENNNKKSIGGRKRKVESLEEKEQRQRDRILRNRHAAQMSRDKKRRQMADLESQNIMLKDENSHLSTRLKVVEEENIALSEKLDTISAQLVDIQSHIAVSEMTKVLLGGVCGSAASAALESDSLALNDGKEGNITFNGNEILESSSRVLQEVPAAARQDVEPLRDVVTNPFFSDLDAFNTSTESAISDLLDSFLDYDWSAEELSSIGRSDGIC